jgi:ribosome assembly protein RRB1
MVIITSLCMTFIFLYEQGQKDLKEMHWHPQISSMIISTAADGFNVLIPTNIDMTIPGAEPGNNDTTMSSVEP